MAIAEEDLIEYEDEEQKVDPKQATTKEPKKYIIYNREAHPTLHSTSFNDYFLKPELMRALADCGFEHPSEGTHITQFNKNVSQKLLWVSTS